MSGRMFNKWRILEQSKSLGAQRGTEVARTTFSCGRVRRNPQAVTRHRGDMREQKKILRDISCANTLNKEWIIPCSGTEREVIQQKELGIAVERTHAH